jgi:hypothetical protein
MASYINPDGFNKYAAGAKTYGSGRSFPTIGPVDPLGYRERDLQQKARMQAILNRLKAVQSGNYMSSAYLGGNNGA